VTFAEAVAVWQALLGQRVKVSMEEHGRVKHAAEGVLKPGVPGATEVIPDEHGRVGFMIVEPGPATSGFFLDPRVVTAAHELPNGRGVRVEMTRGNAVVIERLQP
jgi:hypothetical protein